MNACSVVSHPPVSLAPCPRRLLVVEDDRDMRPIFGAIVDSFASHLLLDWAESVPIAMDRMNRQTYDLVVADFLLDGCGSGLTLKNWCDYNHPTTRFVMMSAFPIAEALVGANPPSAFLRKPFTLAQLRRFLAGQLMGALVR